MNTVPSLTNLAKCAALQAYPPGPQNILTDPNLPVETKYGLSEIAVDGVISPKKALDLLERGALDYERVELYTLFVCNCLKIGNADVFDFVLVEVLAQKAIPDAVFNEATRYAARVHNRTVFDLITQ